jgi:hypothetical protein
LLGLGAPELIVVLVILLVFFSGYVRLVRGEGSAQRGSDPWLTRHEKQILLVLGAVAAVGAGIVVWQRFAR